MTIGRLFNLARMTTATTGTGTLTLGSAVSGYLSFSGAGVPDGAIVSYGIIDGSNSEVGTGTYTSSGTTLTRTVIASTNSGSAINLSGSAEVFITALANNILPAQTTAVQMILNSMANARAAGVAPETARYPPPRPAITGHAASGSHRATARRPRIPGHAPVGTFSLRAGGYAW